MGLWEDIYSCRKVQFFHQSLQLQGISEGCEGCVCSCLGSIVSLCLDPLHRYPAKISPKGRSQIYKMVTGCILRKKEMEFCAVSSKNTEKSISIAMG